MILGMTRKKIAITLPEEQVAAAQRAVAEGRSPVGLGLHLAGPGAPRCGRRAQATLAEIYTEVGQPDASDRAWARQALGLDM